MISMDGMELVALQEEETGDQNDGPCLWIDDVGSTEKMGLWHS